MKEIKLGSYKKKAKLHSQRRFRAPKKLHFSRRRIILGLLSVILIFGGVLFFLLRDYISAFFAGNKCDGDSCVASSGIFDSFAKEPELKRSGNLTNVLLVGIDTRVDQPGLMNTDTIIILSYNHDTDNAVMISLPRDLYVKIPAIYPYWSRINSVYAQGVKDAETLGEGEHEKGMVYLESVTTEITGMEMQYSMMINYAGFIQVIDAFDGIDIDVENEFWGQYPKGEGWEQVHFEQGLQHMDGETALKYARTRYANAESGEASDFARARRQQIVITAAKDKLLSLETMLNPIKLAELAKIAGDNIKVSGYNQEDIRAGIKLAQSLDNSNLLSLVLDPSISGGSLIRRLEGEAYFLGPVSGDWEDVQEFVNGLLTYPTIYKEDAKIYIYNGGASAGAAGVLVTDLLEQNSQLSVFIGGNMQDRSFTGVTIYDFSDGSKSETVKLLSNLISGSEIVSPVPENVDNAYGEDIVIVVGGEEPLTETSNQ